MVVINALFLNFLVLLLDRMKLACFSFDFMLTLCSLCRRRPTERAEHTDPRHGRRPQPERGPDGARGHQHENRRFVATTPQATSDSQPIQ